MGGMFCTEKIYLNIRPKYCVSREFIERPAPLKNLSKEFIVEHF